VLQADPDEQQMPAKSKCIKSEPLSMPGNDMLDM
jgi:hypothetical protein